MLAKRSAISAEKKGRGPLFGTGVLSPGLPGASQLRERGSIVRAEMIPTLERPATNTAILMAEWHAAAAHVGAARCMAIDANRLISNESCRPAKRHAENLCHLPPWTSGRNGGRDLFMSRSLEPIWHPHQK